MGIRKTIALVAAMLAEVVGAAQGIAANSKTRDGEVSAEATAPSDSIQAIDRSLAEYWREHGIEPAPPASDEVFLRRAWLDLAGVTPRVADAREFLSDPRGDRRVRLVRRLVASPRHAGHLANVTRDVLIPAERGDFEARARAVGLRNWLRDRFARNVRYDNIVYELLVATDASDLGPASYFAAHELRPERLAANSSQALLGVSLDCAQCHDHPFADWKQDDFWGMAALFARIETQGSGMQSAQGSRSVVDGPTGEVYLPDDAARTNPVRPRVLGGDAIEEDPYSTRREVLAVWMSRRDNPYLARAAVNSVWRRLFGRGLVEEVHADGAHHPPDHARLLDRIAEDFVAHDFDLNWLWRTLASTRAYGLARGDEGRQRAFAAATPRQLSAEQLLDCLERVAPPAAAYDGAPAAVLYGDPRRDAFVALMRAQSPDATHFSGGTLQALTMLHGEEAERAAAAVGPGLAAAASAPELSADERVQTLYLATLTRMPSARERAVMAAYLDSHGAGSDLPAALGDAVWALLNTAEMAFVP